MDLAYSIEEIAVCPLEVSSMQTCRTAGQLAGLVFLLFSLSYGQSLGDVARQQREQEQAKKEQAKKDQPAPKVITNEDLPEHSIEDSDSETVPPSREPVPHHTSSKSPGQWRAQIAAQKQSIATLQSQMERLNSSIRFARNGSAYYAAQYNEHQINKQEQVQRMQEQLDQQRKRLDDMQEAARKDGFGNAVYDP
jgi:hypothetical protein